MDANSTARMMAIGALVDWETATTDIKYQPFDGHCAAGISCLEPCYTQALWTLFLINSMPHTVDIKPYSSRPVGFVEYSSEQVSSVLDAKYLQHFTLKPTKSINMITSTFVFLGLVASTVLAHPVQRDLGDFDDLVVRDAGADTSVYDIIKTRDLGDLTTRDVGADTSVYDLVHAREYLDERDENDFEERDYDELEGRDYEEFEDRDYEDFEERDYDDLEDRDIDDFLHYARLVARKGGRGGGGGSRSAPKPAPPPKAPAPPPKAPTPPPKAPPKPAAPPKAPQKPAAPPKQPPKPASPPKTPPKPASPPKTPPKPASPPKNPPKPAAPPKQPPKPASPPKTPPKAPAPPKQPPKPAAPPKNPPKQKNPPARQPIDPTTVFQTIPQYVDPFVQIWMQQQQQQTQQEQMEEWIIFTQDAANGTMANDWLILPVESGALVERVLGDATAEA
ncbi:hypothetical protein PC9H_005715 [Pleurotus ostreatus]|uniref:Uncharacterized protein n=1 Tax=Pleurotus ostreatus TaxID=5322 RepID=A0A8H7DVS5_PLEOS|nr:uncharacterized protein PC9H_005715 [Pleurotus ostreatus]KAF7433750.1 hypothetical protein PC9H_005715 [Pleurotus ostreatus]